MHERLVEVYRSESPRILPTMIRLLGDFDPGEEAQRSQSPRAPVPGGLHVELPGMLHRHHALVCLV